MMIVLNTAVWFIYIDERQKDTAFFLGTSHVFKFAIDAICANLRHNTDPRLLFEIVWQHLRLEV